MNELFRKKTEPRCAYCKRGARFGEDQILCSRHGVVASHGSCRAFTYDPLKRVPSPQVKLKAGYTAKDLAL